MRIYILRRTNNGTPGKNFLIKNVGGVAALVCIPHFHPHPKRSHDLQTLVQHLAFVQTTCLQNSYITELYKKLHYLVGTVLNNIEQKA